MSKKKVEPSEPETPEWIMTFADMVSLLVTFFILLMTYSSMEEENFSKMAGSMAGGFGAIADPRASTKESLNKPPPSLQNRVPKDGMRSSRKDLNRVQEQAKAMVRQPGVGNSIDFEMTNEGLRLRVTTRSTFHSGSAEISEETEGVLRELSDLLRIHNQSIVIQGHAWEEGVNIDGPVDPYSVSRERAVAVAEYLRQRGRIPEHRISVSAHGDDRPLDNSVNLESIRTNRRIDILILPNED